MGGGPKGPNRTELISSSPKTAATQGGHGGGPKGPHTIEWSSRPPVLLRALPEREAYSFAPSAEPAEDRAKSVPRPPSVRPEPSHPSSLEDQGGRAAVLTASPVRRRHGPSSVFQSEFAACRLEPQPYISALRARAR